MLKKKFDLTLENGLHARPAGLFVKTIGPQKSQVSIIAGDKVINGKSIMAIMSAGLAGGTSIEISCDGEDEVATMAIIEELFENNFNE